MSWLVATAISRYLIFYAFAICLPLWMAIRLDKEARRWSRSRVRLRSETMEQLALFRVEHKRRVDDYRVSDVNQLNNLAGQLKDKIGQYLRTDHELNQSRDKVPELQRDNERLSRELKDALDEVRGWEEAYRDLLASQKVQHDYAMQLASMDAPPPIEAIAACDKL